MANSGFTTRKQEFEYDRSLLTLNELLAYKVMELIKVIDYSGIDQDECPISTHKHVHWASKFFETFRTVYRLEKHKYQEPKFVDRIKPLMTFLHKRQKNLKNEFEQSQTQKSSTKNSSVNRMDRVPFFDVRSALTAPSDRPDLSLVAVQKNKNGQTLS